MYIISLNSLVAAGIQSPPPPPPLLNIYIHIYIYIYVYYKSELTCRSWNPVTAATAPPLHINTQMYI